MRKSRFASALVMLVAMVVLTGCLFDPEPVETTKAQAQSVADSLVYVKSKNGLCFGVGTTARFSTSGSVAQSSVMVHVECDKVGLGPS